MGSIPGLEDINQAQERISTHLHQTPVLKSRWFNEVSGADVFFKCENFQKTGAFKARGAINAVFSYGDEICGNGFITHSSGNHGAALSYAASLRGAKATIVMPENAVAFKKRAVKAYGGIIVSCKPGIRARDETVKKLLSEQNGTIIPPFNDPLIIAGQATCAMELIKEAGELDAIIAPVGGGGLLSGTAMATKSTSPHTKVYGGEPALADDAYRSLKSGSLVSHDVSTTIADGLRAGLGPLTWDIIKEQVDDIFTVSDEEILSAMKDVMARMKIVIEPSAAVAIAAILGNKEQFSGKRVGIIVSGGNADLDKPAWTA